MHKLAFYVKCATIFYYACRCSSASKPSDSTINIDSIFQGFFNELENKNPADADKLQSFSINVKPRLDNKYAELSKYYLPDLSANLSSQCSRDISAIARAIFHPSAPTEVEDLWQYQLVDSWGKYEDGLMEGNLKALGFFDECLRIDVDEADLGASFVGKYCLISYNIPAAAPNETEIRQWATAAPSKTPMLGFFLLRAYATCMPSTCTEEELRRSVDAQLGEDGRLKRLGTIRCQTDDDPVHFDGVEIFGIVFFCCLGAVLVFASILDEILCYRKMDALREGRLKFLLCFSVPASLKKIFSCTKTKSSNQIWCIQGIRFLSITWVIIGHQFYYASFFTSSEFGFSYKTANFIGQVIYNADKSVDTFLFLSGFLCAFGILTVMSKTNKFPIVAYYVLRFVRLTPPIVVYIIYLATISEFFVRGPYAVQYKDIYVEGCRKRGWMDITYVSNFLFRYADHFTETNGEAMSCITPSWYLAVDMQLYIFMPLIVLPVYFYKKKGLILLGLCTLASVIIPAVIIGVNDTYPSTVLTLNFKESTKYSQLVYMMPYCRATPHMVGIWTAYILWKSPGGITLTKLQVIGGWTLATLAALAVLFGLYPYNYYALDNPIDDFSLAASIIYGSLHRGVWAACIAWMVIACHSGYGGYVNSFLSHPSFFPLGRLQYCIYLVSLPLQFMLFASLIRPPYYNSLVMIQWTCGVLFITGIGALILTLCSESPVISLQRILLSASVKPDKQDDAKNLD